jgi:hypothetical protein
MFRFIARFVTAPRRWYVRKVAAHKLEERVAQTLQNSSDQLMNFGAELNDPFFSEAQSLEPDPEWELIMEALEADGVLDLSFLE